MVRRQKLEDLSIKTRLLLAQKSQTEIALDRLANDDEWVVRYMVAKNPYTGKETLRRLATDEIYLVRRNANEALQQ